MKSVYMAWQAHDPSRAWFPIGRLDFDEERKQYEFAYTRGASLASAKGFSPLVAFPSLQERYVSQELFPIFQNRLLKVGRPEFAEFLHSLAIDSSTPDPIELLAASGGERKTDSLQIFPKIELTADRKFSTRFFVHGSRYLSEDSQAKLDSLKTGDALRVCLEFANPVGGFALQLQTEDYKVIGWCPRFLVNDLLSGLATQQCTFAAKVYQHNSVKTPAERRVLVELAGCFPPDFEPMQSEEYKPYRETSPA
jgi:hypothetical protein